MDQQDDAQDIPMMDAPDPIPNPSPAQRFSIVDVLRNQTDEAGSAKDMTTKGSSLAPDPMHSNLYECDEAIVLQRLQRLYPHTDIQKLPRHWNKNDRWMPGAVAAAHSQQATPGTNTANQAQVLELSSDFLRVTKRKGDTKNSKDAAAVRANRPIPRSCIVFYFEMAVVNKGTGGYMGIGLSEKSVSLNRLPGWDQTSYGYHGDDGNFFASSGKGVEYGPTFTTGDVVGCGLNFITREVFFTKNGTHLGVANTRSVPLTNDLYPIVGMQTADEMIDANFGQRPFVFDIFTEMEGAELATKNAIAAIELPPEKVLWMNSLIAKWMTHEGYSKALESLNRTMVDTKSADVAAQLAKEDRQGSSAVLSSSTSKESQSPTAAAETVANSVMQSIIVFGGGDNTTNDVTASAATSSAAAGITKRPTVVRSVQEALHEEMEHEKMEQRRTVLRMVKRGQLTDAIRHIEKNYPTLMETNRQLTLLLKIQQFLEMLYTVTREMSSSSPVHEQQSLQHPPATSAQLLQYHHHSHRNAVSHSPSSSPRPSSSRGGKRAAALDDDHDVFGGGGGTSMLAGTSSSGADGGGGGGGGGTSDGSGHLRHNPVKRRSSDEECSSMASNDEQQQRSAATVAPVPPPQPHPINRPQQQQNGNSLPPPSALAQIADDDDDDDNYDNNFMDIGEDSRDGLAPMDATSAADLLMMANGGGHYHANGNVLVGTPPTSTTIIDEPADEIDLITDGVPIELTDGQHQDEAAQHGGFTNAEERDKFGRYKPLLEFGHSISQFALKMDAVDGPGQGSLALRQRMNEAFSLVCYPDPTQSDHAYLFDQIQRDLVAKALNAAILEMGGSDSVSPLDKCFRRARYIREQALAFSASAVFADPSRLFDHSDAVFASPSMGDDSSNTAAGDQKLPVVKWGSATTMTMTSSSTATTGAAHLLPSSDADGPKTDNEEEEDEEDE